MGEEKTTQIIYQSPRLKKDKFIAATKNGHDRSSPDYLATNSYFATFLKNKPLYWDALNEMLYGKGRLRKYAGIVEDIIDKFSFLFLARDQIASHESQLNPHKRFFVKYFVYTFVFMTKSFLDALAVFINELYQLGFSGGKIDFKKGGFLKNITNKDNELGNLLSKHQQFIRRVVEYRDNLIHRHGLYVGALPTVPEELVDPKEVDLFILKEPHYIPNNPNLLFDDIDGGKECEFIKVSCFIEDWIKESAQLFDIVLNHFTNYFCIRKTGDDANDQKL